VLYGGEAVLTNIKNILGGGMRALAGVVSLAFLLRINAFLIQPSIFSKEQNIRLPDAAKVLMNIMSNRNLGVGLRALSRHRTPRMTLESGTGQAEVFVSRNGEMDLATFPPHLQVP
jgi:hypothetical protein